jgi:DNA-binding response OmpR family regulator
MKILVVEDESRIAISIKKGLQQERYVVDIAADGEEGYDLASSNSYDVILLDILLPKMDGVTVCRSLRGDGIKTPILMLTAKGQIHDRVTGLDAGADDYLPKPFSFEELLARIRALARRPPNTVQSILRAGNLVLDSTRFEVKRGETIVPLTQKEFSLLEYFLRHSGEIITKNTIIDHVWDYTADILPNTVEVYIKNLRKKIDTPFPQYPPLLHTIRGFGYKIGA